ncbi:Bromodomain-containing protein 7 [Camelus dromedarius]|uniref:Bromodomain-containing protein 7 n=1 Tax=Camelus dromedarius TaxID=9838 RepID=A0A5N4EK36_CAMDR|nr:Bromodomain-containing protein 7 [Camelus dromedarius]
MRQFSTSQGLETPSPKDEGQNETFDIGKDMEFIEMNLGCFDSSNQNRLLCSEGAPVNPKHLSTRHPLNVIYLLDPYYRKMHLAEQETNNLEEQYSNSRGCCGIYGVERIMEISIPSSIIDKNMNS